MRVLAHYRQPSPSREYCRGLREGARGLIVSEVPAEIDNTSGFLEFKAQSFLSLAQGMGPLISSPFFPYVLELSVLLF
jgi:hypothetical protein